MTSAGCELPIHRGGCLCGAVRYEARGAPEIVAHCHCRDCQRLSGAGHSTGAVFAAKCFELTGSAAEYSLTSDAGNVVTRVFCPTCGSPICGRNSGMHGYITITLGTMDDSSQLTPAVAVFTRHRKPWDAVDPSIPSFEGQPAWAPHQLQEDAPEVLHIRDCEPADRESVLALQASADIDLNADVPDGFYDDLHQIETTYPDGAFLVAEISGRIVGMGGLLPSGEVVRMRVAQDFRRRGIARRILEALLDRARRSGFDRVFLHTLREQHAAQRLYLESGFVESGRGELHGNPVIAYQKNLNNTPQVERPR